MAIPSQVGFVLDKKCPPFDAASAAFLSFKARIFDEDVFGLNKIRTRVAKKFGLQISQILVCGSAQFAYSCFKQKAFADGESDLDLAIVSPELYTKMYDAVLDCTAGFLDFRAFKDTKTRDSFYDYLSKRGMIRPDLLPRCAEKIAWDSFFRQLSGEYKVKFKSINAAIYLSEKSFIYKQIPCILAARGELL